MLVYRDVKEWGFSGFVIERNRGILFFPTDFPHCYSYIYGLKKTKTSQD